MTDGNRAMAEGARVAVFGATSGIATALARLYAGEAARLVLIGRDGAALDALAADLNVRGAAATATVLADLAASPALVSVAARAWDAFGGLDVAVLAQGVLPDQAAVMADPALAIDAAAINFTGPAVLALALAERFEGAGRGAIVVLTSVAGDRGRASNFVYGAAKAGLQAFAEGLRHRLHKSGVAVLDVRPGFVATAMTEGFDRSGPLWSTPGRVARDIRRAIARRSAVLYTPWWWRGFMLIIRLLPRALFHRSSL